MKLKDIFMMKGRTSFIFVALMLLAAISGTRGDVRRKKTFTRRPTPAPTPEVPKPCVYDTSCSLIEVRGLGRNREEYNGIYEKAHEDCANWRSYWDWIGYSNINSNAKLMWRPGHGWEIRGRHGRQYFDSLKRASWPELPFDNWKSSSSYSRDDQDIPVISCARVADVHEDIRSTTTTSISNALLWSAASHECASRGQYLCSSEQVCNYGVGDRPSAGYAPADSSGWTAVGSTDGTPRWAYIPASSEDKTQCGNVDVPQEDLITNGSFESSTPIYTGLFKGLESGDSNIDGWAITRGGVDYINTYWQASEGTYSLDMNRDYAGAIEQTVATIKGKKYTVSFDLAGNPDAAGIKTLIVEVAGQSHTFEVDTSSASREDMKWTPKAFTFTATSAETVLKFIGHTADKAWGPALDNVSMVETSVKEDLITTVDLYSCCGDPFPAAPLQPTTKLILFDLPELMEMAETETETDTIGGDENREVTLESGAIYVTEELLIEVAGEAGCESGSIVDNCKAAFRAGLISRLRVGLKGDIAKVGGVPIVGDVYVEITTGAEVEAETGCGLAGCYVHGEAWIGKTQTVGATLTGEIGAGLEVSVGASVITGTEATVETIASVTFNQVSFGASASAMYGAKVQVDFGVEADQGGVEGSASACDTCVGVGFGPAFTTDGCSITVAGEAEAALLVGVGFETKVSMNVCSIGESLEVLSEDVEKWGISVALDVVAGIVSSADAAAAAAAVITNDIGVGNFAADVGDGVTAVAKGFADGTIKFVDGAGQTFDHAGRKITGGLRDAGELIDDAGNWVGGAFDDAGNWVGGAYDDAGNWVGGAASDVGGAASDVGEALCFWCR